MERQPKQNLSVRNSQPKREYRKPKLEVYGDLSHSTRAVGNKGNSDGGSVPKFRTHM
jgi:hypothetical protein